MKRLVSLSSKQATGIIYPERLNRTLNAAVNMETENIISNWDRLKYRVPLMLDGFVPLYHKGKPVDPSSHIQLQLNDKSFQENYELFKYRVVNSMGKEFLPIYRMADGEFKFIINIRELNLITKILNIIGRKTYNTCWGENYTFSELEELKKTYFIQIKSIIEKGILATHFIDNLNGGHPYSKLYKNVASIFNKEEILFNENNYTSFYYVYALLTGPDRSFVLKNKKILIITSYEQKKKISLINYLNKEEADSADFIRISPSKSMYEKIDLSKSAGHYDLVLIGAGIGSSNILYQCEKLNTVCIDAGIVLERYANFELRYSRLFIL